MPKLSDIAKNIEGLQVPEHLHDVEITGITANSSQVKNGFVFFALQGEKTDGNKFIPQAVANGAVVIISNSQQQITNNIYASNPRLALAKMAANFYAKQPKHIVAITGTDGKTSTADFFRQLVALGGKKSASMGTLGVIAGSGENLYEGTLTTPDAVELRRILAELAENDVQGVAIEASSHGLSQYRLEGVKLEAAAFTNIARDHLDYHHTEQAYFEAKARLFSEVLAQGKTAVLNADDARFLELKSICEARKVNIIDFGKTAEKFHIRAINPHGDGQSVLLNLFGKKYNIEVPLVGAFQVMNILAALGLIVGTGGDVEDYLPYIPQLKGVSGRLEKVASLANGASVFIDYAHTPMALENILKTIRPHTKNKLLTVFGCGGDRDTGKRPLMGEIASKFSDIAIVTDDNPRSEDPAKIRGAVMAGGANLKEVGDRKEAIHCAVQQLREGDVLVIAGKGHEKIQIIGDKHLPFDDAEVARSVVRELGLA